MLGKMSNCNLIQTFSSTFDPLFLPPCKILTSVLEASSYIQRSLHMNAGIRIFRPRVCRPSSDGNETHGFLMSISPVEALHLGS